MTFYHFRLKDNSAQTQNFYAQLKQKLQGKPKKLKDMWMFEILIFKILDTGRKLRKALKSLALKSPLKAGKLLRT